MTYNLLSFAEVMQTVWSVLLAILLLLLMITIHEFGHYIAGKILKFKINEFSIGFGPAIFKKRSKKTGELFALRVIPLGGYCAFDGEDDTGEEENKLPLAESEEAPFEELKVEREKADEKKEEAPIPQGKKFNEQAPWKRIIVLVSGALMNYLLALVLLLIMTASYGVPMCIAMPADFKNDGTDDVPYASWETETLSPRDIVLELDGKNIAMITDFVDILDGKKAGDSVSATVLRKTEKGEWKERQVSVSLVGDGVFKDMADVDNVVNTLGLKVYTTTLKRGFWATIGGAFSYSGDMATAVIKTLGQLLTGDLGVDAVGGPVSTIGMTAKATQDPFSFLYTASFIGVNLAVFNLLPIPALDGSKVIFCIIEWIRKKPINRKVETAIHFAGIIFIFGFAILVDLLKLF